MKDIDFEELDRAVSSVLGTKVPQSSSQSPSGDTIDANPVVASTSDDKPKHSPERTSLVQKRSTGRFMDVVHPSSDVKVQKKPTVSRQGVSVKPSTTASLGMDDKPAPSSAATEPIRPIEEEQEAPGSHETSSSAPETVFGPSLMDSVSLDDEASPHETGHTNALEQAASELAELDGIMQDPTGSLPLDTPFVNDSTVEKRPLGAFSMSETDKSLLSDEAKVHLDEAAEDKSDKKNTVDEDMKRAMEAALAGDDAGGESKKLQATQEAAGEVDPPEESSISVKDEPTVDDDTQTPPDAEAGVIPDELASDVVEIESREVDTATQDVASPVAAARTGSIPQQYTTKPEKQSEDIAPVFDTTDYHKPIKHVEKKKSGWLSVVIIIVLILLGAGIGAAVYYFDLLSLIS